MIIEHAAPGLALGFVVGVVLGLLGGGGSILALPIFLYVFGVQPKSAIAMSLAVVGMSAFVGFLGHWRQGKVNLRIAIPFGACAMAAAFLTARLTHLVPETLQLAGFATFAMTAAALMLRDSFRVHPPELTSSTPVDAPRFTPLIGLQAVGVGALTSLIGVGGGFMIVPALVMLAKVPIRVAVGSSLLIIAMNAVTSFVAYIGIVPINWPLVLGFTAVAAAGAVVGTRLNRHVSQIMLKRSFAVLILVLGGYLIAQKL